MKGKDERLKADAKAVVSLGANMVAKWRIGTSGWNYPHWRERFYPAQVPKSKWLEFYTAHFDTVEVNATFYRLPKPNTFKNWYENTPKNFLWSIKASKYITHTKRLKESKEPLEMLYRGADGLKEKLGPILFQLPPSLSYDQERLEQFCRHLNSSYHHVLEIRHPSWIHKHVFKILSDTNMAFCLSDSAGRYPYCEEITADFLYMRLHGSKKLYASKYSEEEMKRWAQKVKAWDMETYIYFDNDYQGYAVQNAKRLKEML